MVANQKILTFSERPDVAGELLAVGRRLGDSSGSRLLSLVTGQDGRVLAEEEIGRGADEVALACSPSPCLTDREALLEAVSQVVKVEQPSIILIGATRTGTEVAARLAQRLGVACASECLALDLDETGNLVIERFVYGGRFISKQVLKSTPKIATVQLKRFEPLPVDGRRRGEIREISVQLPSSRVSVLAANERTRSAIDIGKAEVIIAAGRGVRTKEDLALLEPLAQLLGAEIAGSRPLVEFQWFPPDRQIGLSGRTVKPRLYVACGVSGQIEHIAGIRSARTVVAINTDPNAPIHQEADYSVVGDLYDVVPALVRAFENTKG